MSRFSTHVSVKACEFTHVPALVTKDTRCFAGVLADRSSAIAIARAGEAQGWIRSWSYQGQRAHRAASYLRLKPGAREEGQAYRLATATFHILVRTQPRQYWKRDRRKRRIMAKDKVSGNVRFTVMETTGEKDVVA